MLLTDLDGIVFELPPGSIKKIKRHRHYSKIETEMGDHIKVKESLDHIAYLAVKEGEKNDELRKSDHNR